MTLYFFKDALLHKKEEVFLLNFLQGLDTIFFRVFRKQWNSLGKMDQDYC